MLTNIKQVNAILINDCDNLKLNFQKCIFRCQNDYSRNSIIDTIDIDQRHRKLHFHKYYTGNSNFIRKLKFNSIDNLANNN